MRLAFVKKRFSVHGGAERYMKTLLGALKKEGHDIHIYANRWAEEPGVTFHKVNIFSATSFLSVYSFSKNVASALKREKYDCIVSFERTEYQDIFRAGDGCHKTWLDIRAEVEPEYKKWSFRLNPLHRYMLALEKKIFTETPLIVVNSRLVKGQIMRYYRTPEEKIAVTYNGVDLETYSPENKKKWRAGIRASLGINEADKVLLFVGSGFKRKGVETLIRSLPVIRLQGDQKVIALIVGKGDSAYYRKLSASLGVGNNVLFAGPQQEIARYYAAADVFVLPTIYDPFSNACLEAMASGLPVVTTRNNGAAEIMEDGKEGFCAQSLADPAELAGKISVTIQNAETMGKMARARAGEFAIDKAAEEFTGLIRKTAAQKHQR
jgi:UDP-glucose:(heptosyl)LPS alpha-1,3-glucosyltransferase